MGYIISWYHDSGECKKFIFGGCGGNANRFESIEECEKFCQVNVLVQSCFKFAKYVFIVFIGLLFLYRMIEVVLYDL